VLHTDHVLGEAAAKNIVLKQGRGGTMVLLDTSVEIIGDVFGRIEEMLADDTAGVVGPFGLRTSDLHHFHEGEGEPGDMDAMQAYCFAFRRKRLRQAGLMRERFRFYRNLDLDYSFQFKDAGYRIVADPTLPVRLHEHRVWSALAEGERDEMSRKNYGRFLEKWGDRQDLLVSTQSKR
jgi:cysteinyl-tRNA synthetase